MKEIDTDVRPVEKVPKVLNEHQTVENEESGEPEEYDYSCYK